MWVATMTTGEVFSTSTLIPGHDAASRPAATVYDGRLYIAHRHGQTGEMVLGSFDGASWSSPRYINAGPGGAAIRALEPVLAVRGNYLHVIHQTPESNSVWWTYYDGCAWAAEITINTLQTTYGPSLITGGPGLIMVTTADDTWSGIIETRNVNVSTFTQPLPRFPIPPICGVLTPT